MADRPDCPVPAAVQSYLRHPACSPLDPAAEGENGESKGTSARHAQDQSARTDQEAKDIYAAQTACVLKQRVYKYPNLLQRAFEQCQPNRFWVTDITYIPTPQGMLYLCAVLDLCGRMVLAYRIGSNTAASLVTQTIRDALITEKVTGGLALHSDQGSQYTSTAYFDLSKEYHFRPSMSSPGCPYDNAAMEKFFGTLKSECLYRARYSTRAEVEELIAQYIHFYNFERIHLKKGLTPYEIRSKAV